MLYTAAHTL